MKKELKKLFKGTGIKLDIDKEFTYVNFSLKDYTNCEFYACGDYLTAAYIIDGVEQTVDLHMFDDSKEIVRVVKQILEVA